MSHWGAPGTKGWGPGAPRPQMPAVSRGRALAKPFLSIPLLRVGVWPFARPWGPGGTKAVLGIWWGDLGGRAGPPSLSLPPPQASSPACRVPWPPGTVTVGFLT